MRLGIEFVIRKTWKLVRLATPEDIIFKKLEFTAKAALKNILVIFVEF